MFSFFLFPKKTFILAGKKSKPPKEDTVTYDANSGNIDDVLEQLNKLNRAKGGKPFKMFKAEDFKNLNDEEMKKKLRNEL